MDPPRAAAKMKATTATTVTLLLLLITFLIAVGRSAVEVNAEETAEEAAAKEAAAKAVAEAVAEAAAKAVAEAQAAKADLDAVPNAETALHLHAAAIQALALDPTNMESLAYLEQSLAYPADVPDVPGLPGYHVVQARLRYVALARLHIVQARYMEAQTPGLHIEAPPDLHTEAPPDHTEAPPGYTEAQPPGYTEAQTQPPGSMWIDRMESVESGWESGESGLESCWACLESCLESCLKSCLACLESVPVAGESGESGESGELRDTQYMSQQLRQNQIGNIWAAVGLSTVVFFIMALTLLVIRNLEKQKKSGQKTHAFPIDDVGSATN